MGMDQLLHLAQTLQLSPSLLQSMKILQMTTLELGQYLNSMAEENPVMEYQEESEGLSWEEFSSQVSWLREPPSAGGDWEGAAEYGAAPSQQESLEAFLKDQLDRMRLEAPLLAVAQYLIGMLDHRGQLEQDDLDDLLHSGVPKDLLNRGVAVVQSMEPPGVGARSVEECLVLQLSRLPGEHSLAIQICRECLEDLAGKRYRAIAQKLQVSEEKVRSAVMEMQSLPPNPVGEFDQEQIVEYVRPDAYVAEVEGELRIYANRWDLPHFQISGAYLKMADEGHGKDVEDYLRQKIQQARWVLQCVHRRQSTLETCLTALVRRQRAFFLGEREAPIPLLRRELAQELQIHPSTIGRTLGHKYLQCRQGLFPIDYFFSRGVGKEESLWSEQAVKALMLKAIQQENPAAPLSDQDLVSLLEKQGVALARRTVTKYRTAMGIASSHRRRR